MTDVSVKRALGLIFLLGLLPAAFVLVNSYNYFHGSIIYIVLAGVILMVYWRGKII